MIDTLKLSKGLQKAGMTSEQAEGITEALKDAQTDYVTREGSGRDHCSAQKGSGVGD
jgi:hypothetical protein